MPVEIPRLLIIDDVFGRTHPDRRNEERASLCGQMLLEDVTRDETRSGPGLRIKKPVAKAVFFRGQTPATSVVGGVVENDIEGCLRVIRAGWNGRAPGEPPWSLVLLDLCFYTGRVTPESNRELAGMPEGREGDDSPERYFGLRILQAIREELPDVPVAILSSKQRGDVSRQIDAHGSLAFIPRGEAGAREALQECIGRHGLIADPEGLIVGYSIGVLKALRAARKAASHRRSVLLRGERGTGKELVAAYIHQSSEDPRKRPFVVVDSGALSPELFGSELFGHKKGAFTGATADRQGRIAQADGGDLFLDEIGNMPADIQAGLLRVLQDRRVVPVGADAGAEVDVRFLSATNVDIEARAAIGAFRQDLLDRLRHGATIVLPPLRERQEDIPLLVARFLEDARRENPRALLKEISGEAMGLLTSHDWPGNVRDLESCVRGAVAGNPDVEHLYPHHFEIPGRQQSRGASNAEPGLILMPSEATAKPVPNEADEKMLSRLLASIEAFDFEPLEPKDLAGVLPLVLRAYSRFVARLVAQGLTVTRRPTPDAPAGQVLISPAMKLLTGDITLTATKAADLIKRLLGIAPDEIQDLLESPVLREAREKARGLRGGARAATAPPPDSQ